MMLIGPAPFIPLKFGLINVCIAMFFLGIFAATTCVPPFTEVSEQLGNHRAHISVALMNASEFLGEFFGSLFGGVLTDEFGLAKGMMYMSLFLLGMTLLFLSFTMFSCSCCCSSLVTKVEKSCDEEKEQKISLDEEDNIPTYSDPNGILQSVGIHFPSLSGDCMTKQ